MFFLSLSCDHPYIFPLIMQLGSCLFCVKLDGCCCRWTWVVPNLSVALSKRLLSYSRNACVQCGLLCSSLQDRSTHACIDYIVSATFSNGMTKKIMHFPYNTLTKSGEAQLYAGNLESWENLTCNSNSDNDPNEASSNCSHA